MQEINELYQRDLDKLKEEILAYSSDEMLWQKLPGTNNSGGNLTQHICGNLQHYIGVILGKSGYVRNRDFEFAGTGASREILIAEVQKTKDILQSVLLSIKDDELSAQYPAPPSSYAGYSVKKLLIHIYGHMNYHMGQVNYHRRFFSK